MGGAFYMQPGAHRSVCGIAGIFAHHGDAPRVRAEELRAIRDAMAKRGPDGAGEWLSADGRVGFGHRRLSIIDLSDRASQPMRSHDGKLTVTFNGEIYNYAALRDRLEADGRVFRTTSDTEVLLHLYAVHGAEMVRELRGMFAFAIHDAERGGVFLARDPYGIKPLYYADDGRTLRFASQVRALIAGGAISRTPDPAGQVGFFLWGSVPEPFTSHEAIRALPSGSTLWVDATGTREPMPYFSVGKTWADACSRSDEALDGSALEAYVAEALRDSVKHHLVADVPVSAFLSAGIDSGTLVALMTELGAQGCHAITLAFTEFEGSIDDELPLAREVAREYGVQHHVRYVDENEFARDLPAILAAMDQPSIDGVNTWFVSKATAELGLKVAVSGLGGDELFGGYGTFSEVPRFVHGTAWTKPFPGLGRTLRKLSAPIFGALPNVHPKTAGVFEYGASTPGAYLLKRGLFMPWELPDVLPADVVEHGLNRLSPLARLTEALTPPPKEEFAQVAALEACQYMRNQLLRDTDWASMAHSLEVRVPLVDHVLLQKLSPLLASGPRFDPKALLAQSPKHPLPHAVRSHQKTGFSTPVPKWMQKLPELDGWRGLKLLASPGTPWARRLAYALGEMAFA